MDRVDPVQPLAEDANVLDFTVVGGVDQVDCGDGSRDHQGAKLKHAIDIRSLLEENNGAIFEPELDESTWQQKPEDHSYFNSADNQEQIAAYIEALNLYNEGSDDSNEDEDFESKGRHMANITDDGGVKKKLRVPGAHSLGDVPASATVTIHYSLFLEDQDEPIDSSVLRGRPERHKLDAGKLLPGLEIAIKSMKKKEKADFLIRWRYAYGEMGVPPRIPKTADIFAQIELLDFVQEGFADALLSLSPEERTRQHSFVDILRAVSREHTDGNEYVKQKEWRMAVRRYEKGCRLLEDAMLKDSEEESQQQHVLLKLYLNRGHCYLQIHWPRKACLAMKEALQIEPKSDKAHYRMGRAKRMLGELQEARRCLLKAQQLVPKDESVGRELASLDAQIKAQLDDEEAFCQRMFQGGASNVNRSKEDARPARLDDESFAEIHDQLAAFARDDAQSELLLPASFGPEEIDVAKSAAATLQLEVVKGKQWKIIKRK